MMVQQSNDTVCRIRNKLNLAGFLARSTVNGPGMRSVVWVQGCPLHCSGCFNGGSWSFSPSCQVHPGKLADHILGLDGIDGVTISGGEPFAQAGPLAILGKRLKEHGLTVLTFSGFPVSTLFRKRRRSWNDLLAVTDLLVAGPFIPNIPPVSRLAGSGNQQVISLTGAISLRDDAYPGTQNLVEYTIAPDGILTTTGFPNPLDVQLLATRFRGR
jgi:anaerobic ribonucleoside-triphosphate reductase activating protein